MCNTVLHRSAAVRLKTSVATCASVSGVQQQITSPSVNIAPQAVLFDMDGVLVNSEDLSREYVVTRGGMYIRGEYV